MSARERGQTSGERRGGLRDAHMHLAQLGRAATMVDLGACGSVEECLDALARRADAAPSGWVLGRGMRVEAWSEPRAPTASEFDEATGDRSCCAWSFDHHALVASTAAMRAGGVTEMRGDPKGGVIVRDEAGAPTGLLLERAAHLVWDVVPAPDELERREQVIAACERMRNLGFVEVHELLAPAWLGPVLAELSDAGLLGLRVVLFAPVDEIESAAKSARVWTREDVSLGGGKVFLDGTLNSRTAWMLAPYADPLREHPRGTPMMTQREIDDAIRRCGTLGLPLAAHAIGDAAVRAALDAVERIRPAAGLRIEHAEIIDEADVGRFARLGVTCSPQPCHLLPDMEVLSRLLPHRLDRVLPLRELIDSGLTPGETLLLGSDAPIVRPEPIDSVRAAVDRRRLDVPTPIAPEQAISEQEAWAGFGA